MRDSGSFFPSSLILRKMATGSRPVGQPVNGFIGALILLEHAFTQYFRCRVLLLTGIGRNRGRFSGSFGSVPHGLAIVIAGHFGKLCQGFRAFAFHAPVLGRVFIDQFVISELVARLHLLSFGVGGLHARHGGVYIHRGLGVFFVIFPARCARQIVFLADRRTFIIAEINALVILIGQWQGFRLGFAGIVRIDRKDGPSGARSRVAS